MSKEFPFQAIQFNQTIQFSISMPLFLFNPQTGPRQAPPRRARVNLGATAMKGCSLFPKAPAPLGPYHQTVECHIQDTHWGGSHPSAEVQSVHYTAPANWAICLEEKLAFSFGFFCLMTYQPFWVYVTIAEQKEHLVERFLIEQYT